MELVRKLLRPILAAGAFAAASTFAASALDISGAGATFPYPIYAKWFPHWRSPFWLWFAQPI